MSDAGADKPRPRDLVMAPLAWDSLSPVPGPLFSLFRPTLHDLLPLILSIAIPISVWAACAHSRSLNSIFTFWDCGHFLLLHGPIAGTNFTDPFPAATGRPFEKNVSPLKLQRLIVRAFVLLSAGNIRAGQLLYVIVCSVIVSFLFRRMLIAYGFGRNADLMTCLFSFFPLRFVLFRSLPSYDTLFLCLILAALVFYRRGSLLFLTGTMVLASFVRLEGVCLFGVFAVCYALGRDFPPAVVVATVGFLRVLSIAVFYPTWWDTILPNAIRHGKEQELVTKWPFEFFNVVRKSISHLRQVHTLHMVYVPALFGSVLLLFQSMPLAIFGFGYVIVLSFIQSKDVSRFAIPVHAITILTGCRFFLSAKPVTFVLYCLAPIMVVCELYYCGEQIHSRQILGHLSNLF
jgi:hypothetical protein